MPEEFYVPLAFLYRFVLDTSVFLLNDDISLRNLTQNENDINTTRHSNPVRKLIRTN